MSTAPLLRATVTNDAVGLTNGADVPILVDGADTAITAKGLAGYRPVPADRLLVQKVGGQVEVVQYPTPPIKNVNGAIVPGAAIDPSGNITFNHGIGVQPTSVQLTPITPNRFLSLSSVTSTQVVMQVRDSANNPVTTGTMSFHWFAYVA